VTISIIHIFYLSYLKVQRSCWELKQSMSSSIKDFFSCQKSTTRIPRCAKGVSAVGCEAWADECMTTASSSCAKGVSAVGCEAWAATVSSSCAKGVSAVGCEAWAATASSSCAKGVSAVGCEAWAATASSSCEVTPVVSVALWTNLATLPRGCVFLTPAGGSITVTFSGV
jgi:hypothetical protein